MVVVNGGLMPFRPCHLIIYYISDIIWKFNIVPADLCICKQLCSPLMLIFVRCIYLSIYNAHSVMYNEQYQIVEPVVLLISYSPVLLWYYSICRIRFWLILIDIGWSILLFVLALKMRIFCKIFKVAVMVNDIGVIACMHFHHWAFLYQVVYYAHSFMCITVQLLKIFYFSQIQCIQQNFIIYHISNIYVHIHLCTTLPCHLFESDSSSFTQ